MGAALGWLAGPGFSDLADALEVDWANAAEFRVRHLANTVVRMMTRR